MLNINRTAENGKAVFALEGRLDTISAPELEKSLKEVLDGLSELTLDFGKLDYISSAGLRVLLTTHKKMLSAGGSLTPAAMAGLAGVDVTTDAALNATIDYIGELIDEICRLTEELDGIRA